MTYPSSTAPQRIKSVFASAKSVDRASGGAPCVHAYFMAGSTRVDPQGRGSWFIVIGLALAALSTVLALFAIAGTRDNGGPASQAPPPTITTQTAGDGQTTSPSTRTSPAGSPNLLPGPPVQAPSTVTVTVPGSTVAAEPPPSDGGVSGTATTIAAVTALVGALTGLVAAATGLIKVLQTRDSAAAAHR